MRLAAILRSHVDVVSENRYLRERCVLYAQENDAQRTQLRSAADMFGHLKRQVQDADMQRLADLASIAALQAMVADLARDFDALFGVGEGGAG